MVSGDILEQGLLKGTVSCPLNLVFLSVSLLSL